MRKRDSHQPRTFFFRPGETVTLKALPKTEGASAKFHACRGSNVAESSPDKLVFRLPKQGLGLEVAQLDVDFAGRWDRLHLDPAGIRVSVRGSKGIRYDHRILPGPKSGRWTYRIVSAEPGSTLYFCPEEECGQRMVPAMGTAGRKACASCDGKRVIPVKVPDWKPAKSLRK